MGLLHTEESVGREVGEAAQHGPSEEATRGATGEAEDQAFGKSLADEASPAGADSGAQGELALAGGGAGKKEARDIGAGGEEEGEDGAKEHPGGEFDVVNLAVAERSDDEA